MQTRSLHQLKVNPLNAIIYGNELPDTGLVQSIAEKGILVPLTIKNDGTIISGHRRYAAALELALADIPVVQMEFESDIDEREAIINFNKYRDKTFSQKMMEGEFVEETERLKAKNRQREYYGNQFESALVEIFPQVQPTEQPGKTRDAVAKTVGLGSGKTYETGKKLMEAAKTNEFARELVEKIDKGEATIHGAIKEIKAVKKKEAFNQLIAQQKEDIENGVVAKVNGFYDVISIDPPWNYGREYDPNGSRVANPYPEMTTDEIKNIELPVSDDAIVFLWTTHKFLPDAFDILKTWGFEYKAAITWDKERIGMGAWFRMQCEFCLFAVKGKPIFNNTTERDILREARREHSRKPDGFFDMVDKIAPGRKLEYFSREQRPGWDVFGNDINKFQ